MIAMPEFSFCKYQNGPPRKFGNFFNNFHFVQKPENSDYDSENVYIYGFLCT